MPRYSGPKSMNSRFPGFCVNCKTKFPEGTPILYDGKARHADPAACAEALAAAAAAPVAFPAPAIFANIIALFDAAAESGLKYPTIRFYFEDGFELRLQRAGQDSRFPGCLQVKDGNRTWLGRIQRDGRPERLSDVMVARIAAVSADPVAAARESGYRSGRCTFCGQLLTDEEKSVALGYGPICAKRWNLPHDAAAGREAAAKRDAKASSFAA